MSCPKHYARDTYAYFQSDGNETNPQGDPFIPVNHYFHYISDVNRSRIFRRQFTFNIFSWRAIWRACDIAYETICIRIVCVDIAYVDNYGIILLALHL